MLDVFNFPTPQQSNYQEFLGGASQPIRSWIKPRGVSMVRFLLIGGGAGGRPGTGTGGGNGGGSGAVTSWIGPAIFVPDQLSIVVGAGGASNANGNPSDVIYQNKNSGFRLLRATGGSGSTGATASVNNYFGASGIYTSIDGHSGSIGSSTGQGTNLNASSTTFLSGGAGGAGGASGTGGGVAVNYGYTELPPTTAGGTVAGANGYFITQPILLGVGGAGGTTSTTVGTAGGRGGIGCGGGGGGEDALTGGGRGGDGAVFIWAW